MKLLIRSVNAVTLRQSLRDLYDVDRSLSQVYGSALVSSALEFPFNLAQDASRSGSSFSPT